jgi:hypothetical protein
VFIPDWTYTGNTVQTRLAGGAWSITSGGDTWTGDASQGWTYGGSGSLAVKLRVDGGQLHADLRASGAHDRHGLASWLALNVRNAAHRNNRLPLLATVGSA